MILKVAKERKIEENLIDKLVIASVIGGIIGARLYHVLDNLTYYSENVVKIFMIWDGGLGIWGGIAGGVISVYLTFSIAHCTFLIRDVWDLGAIGLPLGQSIGRWGNFFNNEIVGKNGEPLFFYESLATFILFLAICYLREKRKHRLMGIYLLGYGGIRLLLENFRVPGDTWVIGNFSVSTALSIVAIVAGIIWQR